MQTGLCSSTGFQGDKVINQREISPINGLLKIIFTAAEVERIQHQEVVRWTVNKDEDTLANQAPEENNGILFELVGLFRM